MTKRSENTIRCAGCHRSGVSVEVQTVDDKPIDDAWLVPPPGWMLGPMNDASGEWLFVCSEPCLRIVTSRMKGVEVAAQLAVHDRARQALEIVTSARARDLGDETFCSHCRENVADPKLTDDSDDWCSEECKACQAPGGWCTHTAKHLGRMEREHRMLGEEIERLRQENAMLRGTLGLEPNEGEMETVAAEILALDGRATASPWGEKCGVLKHYVFSKDPGEDFGALFQEMHWSDGHIVPAHDNGSLIAFYRNYAPSLARSWAILRRRSLLWKAAMNAASSALLSAEEMLSSLSKLVPAATIDPVVRSLVRVRQELDGVKED